MTTRTLVRMVVLGVLGPGASAEAKEIQLAPSSSLRVVNPSDPADVRVLYVFTLPEDVQAANVVRTFLTLPTSGTSEAPVAVGPLDAAWSSQDTWASLETKLQGSKAFDGLDDRAVIACNWIEEVGGVINDSGIEGGVTEWARD